jgi:hypothetical protein
VEKYKLGKNHWLLKKEGKKLKSFELPPQLSLKKFCTIFLLVRASKKLNSS